MKNATLLCAAISIAFNVAVSSGGVRSISGESKLKRDLDAQLPVESRYNFPAVIKEWIKATHYIDPILLERYDPQKITQDQKKRFEKEDVFSKTGKDEGDRRIITYDPDGKLRHIGDWRGDDGFSQSVYPDGTIKGYMHHRKGKLLEAYSVSLDGKQVDRVVRGSGILRIYSGKSGKYARNAYHEGGLFFSGFYEANKLTMAWLRADKDELMRWRSGSEEFSLDSKRTWWGRDGKGKVKLRKLDGKYDLETIDPDRVKLWQEKYAEAVSAFCDRYEAALKKAGCTWAKLDIDFVRNGKPFPD